MDDAKTQIESHRKWVVENTLRTVGFLWLSGIAGSIAYNWSRPNLKTSLKMIHDAKYLPGGRIIYKRVYPEFITVVAAATAATVAAAAASAAAAAAAVEYYDHKTGAKARNSEH